MKNKNEVYAKTFVGVHGYFKNSNGEVLVLQRASTNRYKPLKWDVPGGKMQSGEDIVVALKREVLEETSLNVISVGKPLSVYVNTDQLPEREDVQIVFECVVENTDKPIILQPDEHDTYKWVLPENLGSIDCMDYLNYFRETVLGQTI